MTQTAKSPTNKKNSYPDVKDLPKNLEAERALLGAMLLDPRSVLIDIEGNVSPGSLYQRGHRIIFEKILELAAQNVQVDLITVGDAIDADGQLELVGGRTYIHELINYGTTTTSALYYANIIQQKANAREAIQLGLQLIEAAHGEPENFDQFIARSQAKLESLSDPRSQVHIEPFDFDTKHVECKEIA